MGEHFVMEDLWNTMIELENRSYEFYCKHSKQVEAVSLQKLFLELANAEKNHEQVYRSMKNRNAGSFNEELAENPEYKSYVRALIDNHFAIYQREQEASSIEEILKVAEQMEKDTILFLNELKLLVIDVDGLMVILEEEKRHLVRIYQYRKALMQ